MKTTINIVPAPTFSSFIMFEKINLSKLIESKEVIVSYTFVTKTRISVSMKIGEARNNINFKLPNYKQFVKSGHSYATGNAETSCYFIKSKKQDFEVFKEYVKELVTIAITEYLKVTEIDELTINLEQRKIW